MTTDLTENDMNTTSPLSLITSGPRQDPPRIVLYGDQGIGKTEWASHAPGCVYIPVESGLGRLTVPAFPQPGDYQDVLDDIEALRTGEHNYRSLVLDTLDAMEPMLFAAVANRYGKENIEAFGYAKGYMTFAPLEWRNFLDSLDALRAERGMAIILIAHAAASKFEPPDADPYDRWTMRLNKWTQPIVEDWADAIFFAKYTTTVVTRGERTRGIGDGSRSIYTSERPAWKAKNRWGLPEQLPYEKGQGWAAFMAAYSEAMNEPIEPINTEPTELEATNA